MIALLSREIGVLELITSFNAISVVWVSICNTRGLEKEL